MSPEEYIRDRVDKQIEWYSNKSTVNQNWFKSLKIVEIVCAAIIPFIAGVNQYIQYGNYIIALLGVLIAICVGISSIYHHQENWINYRATSETLKHEKYLFMTKTGRYTGENSFENFVQCIEGHISRENTSWASVVKSKNGKNA